MSSTLGTPLPRRSPAWFWVAVAGLPALYFAWNATWPAAAVLAVIAVSISLEPRLRKLEYETVQVDDTGVLRVAGEVKEQIHWKDIVEIRIVTTDEGPYQEDVFFVLAGDEGKGCLVPHDAAVRTKLLQELQTRFVTLDDKMVIEAMGSTSNNSFLLWKKAATNAA
jgi:hypothetical protein